MQQTATAVPSAAKEKTEMTFLIPNTRRRRGGIKIEGTNDLEAFKFPVAERFVGVANGINDMIDIGNPDTHLQHGYKAIVREDTNKCISILRQTYKLQTNAEILDELMSKLKIIDKEFKINAKHSFCMDERMRLHVEFPGLIVEDEGGDLALSLFVHNSYDMSEGVRLFWGAIRVEDGAAFVFNGILKGYYHKHTDSLNLNNFKEELESTYGHIPEIHKRIEFLTSQIVDEPMYKKLKKNLGSTLVDEILPSGEPADLKKRAMSMWECYTTLAKMVSNQIDIQYRARYQHALSKAFGL